MSSDEGNLQHKSNPLIDKELIDMFMGILHVQYMENMVEAKFPTFSEVVNVGEKTEIQVKKGKPTCASVASSGWTSPYYNFQKKKEGETNVVMGG